MNLEKKYLTINELKPLWLYKIKARNGYIGIWNAEDKAFLLPRNKLGEWYVFEEYYYGDDFGTAKPICELEETSFTQEDLRLKTFYYGQLKYSDYESKVLDYLMIKKEEYKD